MLTARRESEGGGQERGVERGARGWGRDALYYVYKKRQQKEGLVCFRTVPKSTKEGKRKGKKQ